MKQIGYLLIAAGIALFIFVIYSFLKHDERIRSPLPDDGVKVIFITPGEKK